MSFHFFHITEVYSNSDGNVQFIEFVGDANGQHLWAGHEIISTDGVDTNQYPITLNLPSSATDDRSVLVATQGFADLGLVTPDYIVPNDFLFLTDGQAIFPDMDELAYDSLPVSGTQSLDGSGATIANSPTNFAGQTGSIPGNPIVGTSAANGITGTSAKDFIVGLGGNDVMNGGGGNDTMKGGAGADTLNGSSGTDRIQGDAGNDKMTWGAGDFFDGGANTDTLKVGVATLDLTTAANSNNRLLNIEQIDLKAGAHTLTLNKSDVLAMSPTDSIKIFGDGADTVNIAGSQVEGGSAPVGFTRYRIGTAVLTIDSDINVI